MFPLDQYDLGVEANIGILNDDLDPLTAASLGSAMLDDEELDPHALLAPTAPHSPRDDNFVPGGGFPAPGAGKEVEAIVAEMVATNPTLDYTPPRYITLLLTDKGVLAPAAVSDELLKVFL